MIKFRVSLLVLLLSIVTSAAAGEAQTPKNIILIIGDGMGLSHVTAGRIANGDLHLERCPVGGFLATHSANRMVTDSAASATAYSTGFKVNNGALAWSVMGAPLKTVMEIAQDKGKATGLVALCTVTHATPAAFVTHVGSRNSADEIAEQIAASRLDVLIGGGWGYFVPQSIEGSLRKDDKNLIPVLEQRMKVVRTAEDLADSTDLNRVAALLEIKDPPPAAERSYALADLTRAAIQMLNRSEAGFVLMIEGSQVDWRAHSNEGPAMVQEVLDLDRAVGMALDFADADGSTLVLVTADHETGGATLINGSIEQREVTEFGWATKGHSGAMVPLFASGPGSRQFGGIHDNTFIGQRLKRLVALDR